MNTQDIKIREVQAEVGMELIHFPDKATLSKTDLNPPLLTFRGGGNIFLNEDIGLKISGGYGRGVKDSVFSALSDTAFYGKVGVILQHGMPLTKQKDISLELSAIPQVGYVDYTSTLETKLYTKDQSTSFNRIETETTQLMTWGAEARANLKWQHLTLGAHIGFDTLLYGDRLGGASLDYGVHVGWSQPIPLELFSKTSSDKKSKN